MARRLAFLIGNQTFKPDSGLAPLQGPVNDVAALARLLRDPERGRFEVHEFLNKTCYEVLPDIAQALNDAAVGDFFLIYYSGHGKLDRNGRLCLATADTRQGALVATSIPTRQLRDLVEQSDCDQVLLLLDCCYSGAVEDGLRGDVGDELHVVEDARGFYIATASTGIQIARETAPASGGVVMGRFTAALVDGIENGAADLGHTGKILLSDLRRYLGQAVTGQTPQFFDRKASGDPLICLSPATALPLLSAGVLTDLEADHWHRRRGAVFALADVLQDGDAPAQAAARAALQRRLEQERDYIVRADLKAALDLGPANTRQGPQREISSDEPISIPSTIRKFLPRFPSKLRSRILLLAFWAFSGVIMWVPAAELYGYFTRKSIVSGSPAESSGAFLYLLLFALLGIVLFVRGRQIFPKDEKIFICFMIAIFLAGAIVCLFVS